MNYENTLTELIEYLLRVPLQDFKGGTVTSSSTATTTLVDSKRDEPDDYFQNTTPVSRVHITSTTDGLAPIGEDRKVTDFVSGATGTGTLTIAPAFSAVMTVGDKYLVLSKYGWDEIKATINLAISAVAGRTLAHKVDETLYLQNDTYEYAIPAGFTHIYRLSQSDSNWDYPYPIPPDQYKILKTPSPRIHFYRFPTEVQHSGIYWAELWANSDLVDGRGLRIEGYGRHPKLENEQDVCYINPDYVVYQAAAYLHAARIKPDNLDYENHKTQFEICQGLANQYKADIRTQLMPDTKKVTE